MVGRVECFEDGDLVSKLGAKRFNLFYQFMQLPKGKRDWSNFVEQQVAGWIDYDRVHNLTFKL